jgi:hypothetical protein
VTPSVSCSGVPSAPSKKQDISGSTPAGLHQGLHQIPSSNSVQPSDPIVAALASLLGSLTNDQRGALARMLTISRGANESSGGES